MSIQKRLVYMVIGAFMALALFIGAYGVFAQSGSDGDSEETTVPEVETETEEPEAGAAENSTDDESSAQTDGRFGFHSFESAADSELLAAALGITVEELQAAYDVATAAALQQAVDEGLLTEDQAEELTARGFGFRGLHIGTVDFEVHLAEALDITVEELQAARQEAHAARLAELVEAGAITQEQADLMLARMAVQNHLDTEAVSDALQSAYEAAVNSALAAGDITQEQADLMLENMPDFDGMGLGLGGPGFHGRGLHQGRGAHHGPGGHHNGFFGGSSFAPSLDSSSVESSGA
jgi:hypothetical protein